ncbi:type I restriction enzyme endonuclease domain-containing protein, partial [Streptococcus agalactiae]
LGLSEAEVALYDAIIQNDSAIMEMGDETLKTIARELVATIQRSATIDWTLKETVRARMRSRIKRLLAKHKYPPDKQEEAVKLIIEQAE